MQEVVVAATTSDTGGCGRAYNLRFFSEISSVVSRRAAWARTARFHIDTQGVDEPRHAQRRIVFDGYGRMGPNDAALIRKRKRAGGRQLRASLLAPVEGLASEPEQMDLMALECVHVGDRSPPGRGQFA